MISIVVNHGNRSEFVVLDSDYAAVLWLTKRAFALDKEGVWRKGNAHALIKKEE